MPVNNCPSSFNLGQLVTWILVIGGWFIINFQHNRREDRKESRAAIDRIREYAHVLEVEAINAHKAGSITADDVSNITWKIKKLIDDIEYCILLPKDERNAHAKYLRKSITLDNLDPSNHLALQEDHKIIREIRTAFDDLIGSVEKHFRSKYPFS